MGTRRISDTEAIEAIHRLLSGREWSGADDMQEIAILIQETGREVLPTSEDTDDDA